MEKKHMTSLWRHFCPIFVFEKSIYILLMSDYHHTKFGVIWINEGKVMKGGGGWILPPPPPPVENVL